MFYASNKLHLSLYLLYSFGIQFVRSAFPASSLGVRGRVLRNA